MSNALGVPKQLVRKRIIERKKTDQVFLHAEPSANNP